MSERWSEEDRRSLEERGISGQEAERQLALLRTPPPPTRLDRAATVGDGIERLGAGGERERMDAFDAIVAAQRLTRFVPASGAATRMFRDLLEELDEPSEHSAIERLIAALPSLPFDPMLEQAIAATGVDLATAEARPAAARRLAEALLRGDGDGQGLAELPKGLIPFHRARSQAGRVLLSPAEEHVAETVALAGRSARLHFTVAPEHEERFAELLRAFDPAAEVGFSQQLPATDTLALTEDGRPLRDEDGKLVLRPGGHGALIGNLERAPSDVVAIRNIDNVLRADRRDERQLWNRRLIGELALFERQVHGALEALHRRRDPAAALRVAERLGTPGDDADEVARALDRPLRVCGMVENLGEPGGGPFWVAGNGSHPALQIVESSQIDSADPTQAETAASATHFNPADLVCSLRRWDGGRFELDPLVDPETSFVATKSHQGRPIRALERPGLWNGAMAGWLTRFVELPASTFAPVKTVWDLLRPEHQPDESSQGA
ncbi:MAG TPA: DUF4301 family protein [Thermoanaerobaculia bacterium]|nr:DUF4301 family protein [Thermoanaerobaculia bacterium]